MAAIEPRAHTQIDSHPRLRRMRVMAPPASMGPFYSDNGMSDEFLLDPGMDLLIDICCM